jgi:hypothetical protein
MIGDGVIDIKSVRDNECSIAAGGPAAVAGLGPERSGDA